MWLAEHEPQVHARIRHVLLPKDYIGLRLHGHHITDPCDAAGTWWFDESARRWSDRLCAATATHPAWLPEVRNGTDIAGHLTADAAQALGLPSGIAVATGGGDAATGAVAVRAVTDGTGFLSLCTSGQIFVATRQYRAAPEHGIHSYAHCLPDTWFQMAAMLNGARPMSWFAEITGQSVRALLQSAAGVATDRLPLFMPYLSGERTPPCGQRDSRRILRSEQQYWQGRDDARDPRCHRLQHSRCARRDRIGPPLPPVLLDIGGGSRRDLLLQTIADVLGQTLHRGADAEMGPALGAARLAGAAVGALDLKNLASPPPVSAIFIPQDSPRHQSRLAAYRALYTALQSARDLPR